MTEIVRKPVAGKPAHDGYRCALCSTWIEDRDLGEVLAHEGPLPHRSEDRKYKNGRWMRFKLLRENDRT
jgi:hypothetical protein